MMMKVCMLTSFHDSQDVRIFHKEARTLSKAHEVTIIAPGDDDVTTSVDGITIKTFKRERSKLRHWRNILNLLKLARAEEYDVYHAHEPGSLFVGVLLKKTRGGALIYDSHELYPAIISENSSLPRRLRKLTFNISYALENVLISSTDQIITVSNLLVKRFEKSGKDVKVIYNVPLLGNYNLKTVREKKVIYIGNVSKKRGLTEFLEALRIVKSSYPDVVFQILGKIYDDDRYKKSIDEYIIRHRLADNFQMIEWVPSNEVPPYISNACIGVILFQPDSLNNRVGVPNKLFEYMAAGIPVIGSDLPGLRSIISDEKCGLLVDSLNHVIVANAINSLLGDSKMSIEMGNNGRNAVLSRYNWDLMEPLLLQCYSDL